MLAITFAVKTDYDKIREDDRIDILGLDTFEAGKQLTVRLNHSDFTMDEFTANHTYNQNQIEWFIAGSALNLIKEKGL